jgi:hypothetical protein
MDTATLSEQFKMLLERGAQELFEDHRDRMVCADRARRPVQYPRPPGNGGRWGLLSRGKRGCRYNAGYLSQISAYVEAIHDLGYPRERVFFELPHVALKLDLAILGDDGAVLGLGEAKRAVFMLDALLKEIQGQYSAADPGEEGRKRGSPTRLAPLANPSTLLLVHRPSKSTRVSRAL